MSCGRAGKSGIEEKSEAEREELLKCSMNLQESLERISFEFVWFLTLCLKTSFADNSRRSASRLLLPMIPAANRLFPTSPIRPRRRPLIITDSIIRRRKTAVMSQSQQLIATLRCSPKLSRPKSLKLSADFLPSTASSGYNFVF
jgi:hypothetical protein